MTDKPLFLGVDGGGTKTEFVCIDANGREVARATTGTTYHLEVGFQEAVERVRNGVTAICKALAVEPTALDYSFFGLPAYGEDAVIDPQLEEACGRILGHERYECGNDMVCGWAGSLGCEDGINIVAGTGSIGYGERQGKAARAGGWGEVFSDEGSAYWIAIRGLATFARMSDGRMAKGALHGHFKNALALDADVDVCAKVMGAGGMSRAEIAGLAPLVSNAAEDGDEAAHQILIEAARELADIACAIRSALGFERDAAVPLSWSGSVLTQVEPVRTAFVDLLGRAGNFRFVAPQHPPAYGAALYARRRSLLRSDDAPSEAPDG
jgi:N-acetylglucosamine kinase-like BadF-type ATPase